MQTNFSFPLMLLFFGLLCCGCPSAPMTPEGGEATSAPGDGPTDVTVTPDTDTPPAEPAPQVTPDDAEVVAKLKEAGAVLKTNDAGLVVDANCKPAQMTNELMALLKGIPHVEKLDLENGQFDNEALAVVEHLPNLKSLNLRQCSNLDENGFAHLKKAPQLERLMLLYTRANDATLAHVGELKNLIVLDLRGTKIGDEGVNHLAGLTKLVDLKIRAPNVSGDSMATIAKMTKLRTLALEDASLGDDDITTLATLKSLVDFNIMRTYVGDDGLSKFSDQKIKDLRVRDTAVTGAGLDGLTNSIDTLTYLDMSEVLIDNEGLSHISPFKNLETLSVWNGTMDDEGLKSLIGLSKLKSLDVHGCRSLTTGCADVLVQIASLEEINLAETSLDNDGLMKLAELPNLKVIDVGQTAVNSEGIAAFKEKKTDCRVVE